MVEVSDTTQREDLGRKRVICCANTGAIYAAGGVPEYWVVDLAAQRVHQHWAPRDGDYAETAVVPFGEELRARALPGVAVETAVLLA